MGAHLKARRPAPKFHLSVLGQLGGPLGPLGPLAGPLVVPLALWSRGEGF